MTSMLEQDWVLLLAGTRGPEAQRHHSNMHFDCEIKDMIGRTQRIGLAEEKERKKEGFQDQGLHVAAFWPLLHPLLKLG